MQKVSPEVRDAVAAAFREAICDRLGVTPLVHQRAWWAATDGLVLTDQLDPDNGQTVFTDEQTIEKRLVMPRPEGPARVVSLLGAFKGGKSFGAGLWMSGFAAVPGRNIGLVGLEYDTVSPEFNYICEFLLSEQGMNLKFDSLQNRPRDGKMWLDLKNGTRYHARSWERKETLKGKEEDVYCFCEAYQLPGLECYSTIKQNLVARDGIAIFPTTPDRPWVEILHQRGHGDPMFPEWQCFCGVPRKANPYTFIEKDFEQDKLLLTSEKFKIAHLGQLGEYVGRVFNYQRGQSLFTASTHPDLFDGGGSRPENLRIPDGWEIVGAADTGTYYTALVVAFAPNGDAFVLAEFPNYRYVAGAPERDESIAIPEWARRVEHAIVAWGGRAGLWADKNSQFKRELLNYGITLLPASAPVETRTEIAREYFQHKRIFLAPWLDILPFELENAQWPEEESAAGKFARIKDRDHTLDCLEHILARRPYGRVPEGEKEKGSWIASYVAGAQTRKDHSTVLGRF